MPSPVIPLGETSTPNWSFYGVTLLPPRPMRINAPSDLGEIYSHSHNVQLEKGILYL